MALSVVMFALSAGEAAESSGDTFPPAYDLRDYGYVPAVMDQGKDQTCWTFAAMTAIHSNYLMNVAQGYYNDFLGSAPDLSELHLAWFSFKNPERKQNFAFIKNGSIIADPADDDVLNHPGHPQMAVAFLSRQDGPVKESELPYSGPKPSAGTSPRDYAPALRVVRASYLEDLDMDGEVLVSKDVMIKACLQYSGAVDIGVYWSNGYMSQNYAYYNPYASGGGHAVTIIGWDDNYSRENFGLIKPKNNGAWLVQNSWGTDWGNGGYFWISYEQDIRYAMGFDTEPVNPRVREYYYDDLGLTHEVLVTDSKGEIGNTLVANVFKVRGDHEKLREVGYYSTNPNFMKLIAVYDLGTENSVASLNAAQSDTSKLKSMGFVFSVGIGNGYAVEMLPQVVPLTKDHYFAITMVDGTLVPLSNDTFKYAIPAEVQISGRKTAYAEVGANETYFKINSDDWRDAKNYTFLVGDTEVTGFNACVKGFTYVPDERVADDWTLVSADKKAQLTISLLKDTAPRRISLKGNGLSNVMYKIEPEDNADTAGASGKFYTLKVICDVEDFENATITSLVIDGQETISGSIDVPISQRAMEGHNLTFTEWDYFDIRKTGVQFKYMTRASGTIESTEGYTANNETAPNIENTSSGSGGSGGCNSAVSVLGLGLILLALVSRRRA